MKKVLSITIMLLMLVSCNQSKFGKGGENAEQFIREKAVLVREDIATIETIREDSVLSNIGIGFEVNRLLKAGTNYLQGTITRDDYTKTINEATLLMKDIQDCWENPEVVGDSLRRIGKYDGMWRKAYTVDITMKSSVTTTRIVIMDRDGITPSITDKDFSKILYDFSREIARAINSL